MIPSLRSLGGYVWKFNPRITETQKQSMRKRMKTIDSNIENITMALSNSNHSKIQFWKNEYPKSSEMDSRDKYTTFNPHYKDYRKPVHRVPKWTKLSFRSNPKHF
ncbi:unnamed protein product [Candida verbasci]|uniref:54S ribosomal protein L31, mitochondrial n=1 Tax=Candida verbasci TaxID=1227364 RepID=A0A9W4TU74_9ASCO|nr:unnamed protein product [Candida verbasci]